MYVTIIDMQSALCTMQWELDASPCILHLLTTSEPPLIEPCAPTMSTLPVQAPDDSNIGLQELDQVLLRAGHPANLMNLPVRKMVNR